MKKILLIALLTICSVVAMVAQRTVVGQLTGDDGEPLIGASVLVKGTSIGTVTNLEGNYSINVPRGSDVLVYSYTGYNPQEITLGASNVVSISLTADTKVLDEVVVTALGISKSEKSLGYAVQQVDANEVRGSTETNMVQALAGKVAGLNVVGSTGTAGASSYATIRGANSINRDNQPLYVIDGVPIDNSQLYSSADRSINAGLASVAYSNRAIDINPNEIESISVLKGAAATAVYGSLAGNGAIIITTKKGKGKDGRVAVDYSTSLTFSNISQVPALQHKYSQGVGGVYAAPPTSTQAGSWGALIDTLRYANNAGSYLWNKNGSIVSMNDTLSSGRAVETYDQYDFFRTGVSTANNLGFSYGADRFNTRFSLGYTKDNGIVPNNKFDRYNVGLNSEVRLWSKVTAGMNLQYINSGGTRIEQGSNTSGVMLGLLRTPPTFDNSNGIADAGDDLAASEAAYVLGDGTGRPRSYRGAGNIYDNPYWTAARNPLRDRVNRIIGSLNLSWDILDGLNFTYRPGVDYYNDTRKQYFSRYSATASAGRIVHDRYNSSIFNQDAILSYTRKLTDDLGFQVRLGHRLYQNKLDRLFVQGDGFVTTGFNDLSNTLGLVSFETQSIGRRQAGYGILNLDYANWLYLEGTFTREQDLSLPEKNNSFNYYSTSLGLVFSELLDLSDNQYFNYGKLRASYGLVGLGTFAYSTKTVFEKTSFADGWTEGIIFPLNGVSAFSDGDVLGNPDLKPERRASWEIGTDLRFWKNRISLDLSYYESLSKDIILSVPIAATSGYRSIILNAGEMSNKGVEAILGITPVQNKDFTWDITFNYAQNRNKVEKLADGVDQVFLGGFEGASTRAVKDYAYGTIFGFGFYKDANGNRVIGSDGFPILDPNEKAFSSAQPRFNLGIRNSFTFKGVTLSALLDIRKGGYMWNGTRSALYFFGTHQETADLRNTTTTFQGAVAEYDAEGNVVLWDHDGNTTTPDVPKTVGANTQQVTLDENWLRLGNANGFNGSNTEDFIEKTDWVRLRDISLAYAFPKAWAKKVRLASLSFSITGRNLFLSTPYKGVDPETNLLGANNAQGLDYFNMPNTKSVTIGLQAGF
ncbi:MAG: SusC/RagA family TonB-linked outer membrane protein [Saprospiraceae bacterium]|nr:SusC/RagA family TonB-linked outer membrane protein [Saprospiraceae bacterium]MBP7699437.1 SusC/RagA family TonB-linked outer membrane protein [Saprospiraceae bacterium]